jgi:hypothetical protein
MVVIELVSRPADKKDITKGRPADQKDAGGSLTKAESPQPKTPAAAHA